MNHNGSDYNHWELTDNCNSNNAKENRNCSCECGDQRGFRPQCIPGPQFPQIPQCIPGPQGPQGPPGPPGPPGDTTQLRGIQVQLQGQTATIEDGSPVVFDTLVSPQSSFISYNALTGTITITQSGVYYVNWWVSVDGTDGAPTITFAVITSAGDNVRASSPIISGQMNGNALLSIVASPLNPVTLQLLNTNGGIVGYGATPIRADLTIIHVAV